MCENCSGSKSLFQEVESLSAILSEIPRSIFMSKPSQRHSNLTVVRNKMSVKVSKTKEGLNIFNFAWLRLFKD